MDEQNVSVMESEDHGEDSAAAAEPEIIHPAAEAVYSMDECARNARKFGVRKEFVVAAFKYFGRTVATEKEAAAMIEDFRKKEVE